MHDAFAVINAATIASKNDYCGGKPGLSLPPLILTGTKTLNPNPKDVTKTNLTLLTLLTQIDLLQTLVYRRNSHFRRKDLFKLGSHILRSD